MRLALGTAQFGLDYGISNPYGKVAPSEVRRILEFAKSNGIDVLDTAHSYGTSESTLGSILKDSDYPFKIITKTPNCPVRDIRSFFLESLENLHQDCVYGLLFHSFDALSSDLNSWKVFTDLKKEGLVKKIGISLYHPEEWQFLADNGICPDIVQIPYSVFDQRFFPVFQDIKRYEVEIHSRSAFLQGLYFLDADNLSDFFKPLASSLKKIKECADQERLSIAEICLLFVLNSKEIDWVVIGVNSLANLRENWEAVSRKSVSFAGLSKLRDLNVSEKKMILPYLWPKKD